MRWKLTFWSGVFRLNDWCLWLLLRGLTRTLWRFRLGFLSNYILLIFVFKIFIASCSRELWLAKLSHLLCLSRCFILVLVDLRFILDNRVPYRTHFINLTTEVILWQRRQLFAAHLVPMMTLITDLCFSGATFFHNTVDVDKSVWGALNRPLILFYIVHLPFNNARVYMRRNCLRLKTLHKLSILDVYSLGLTLFIYEIEGALLFERMRAVNNCARAHVWLK